jgi:hypothetical protein
VLAVIAIRLERNHPSLRNRRQLDVLRAGGYVAQQLESTIDGRRDLRINVFVERRPWHTEAQVSGRAGRRLQIVRDVGHDAGWVERIVAGDRTEHERCIGHRTTHGADMIEGLAEGNDASYAG